MILTRPCGSHRPSAEKRRRPTAAGDSPHGRDGTMILAPIHPHDDLQTGFLATREQLPTEVATCLVDFLRGAERSLAMAIYDFRLSDPLKTVLTTALRERANAGVTKIGRAHV